MQDQIAAKKIESYTKLRKDVHQQLVAIEEKLHQQADPILEAQLEIGMKLSNDLQELMSYVKGTDWQKELEKEIEVYETAKAFTRFDEAYFGVSDIDMQKAIILNNELLNRELPKEDFNLSIQTSIFMKKIISLVMNPIGFILMLFVMGLIVTKEFDDETIRLVLTLPVSRIQYLLIKFISLLLLGLIWLLIVFLSSYLLGQLFSPSKSGNVFHYPLYTSQNNFVSSGEYLIQSFIYCFLFMAFAISLLLLFGYLLQNSIVTYSSLLFIFSGGWLLSNYGFYHVLNPFSYQMVETIILDFPEFHPTGFVVLTVATILILISTIISIRKRGV